jgi:F-type H+-transporting ATPase subunit alpha
VKSLNQNERDPLAVEDQVAVVYAATNGFLDRIAVDRVPEFNLQLVERLHADAADVLKTIREGDWSDGTQESLRNAIEQFGDDFGYDLDEEGHPLTDEDTIRSEERRRREPAQESGEAREPEAVGAEA